MDRDLGDRDPGRPKHVAKHGRQRRVGHQLVERVERTDDLERTRLELGVVDDRQPALAPARSSGVCSKRSLRLRRLWLIGPR